MDKINGLLKFIYPVASNGWETFFVLSFPLAPAPSGAGLVGNLSSYKLREISQNDSGQARMTDLYGVLDNE